MIDPSNIKIPFVSTWRRGMNLCKGLNFANKVEVKHALTICALKENKHFMISKSMKIKLCAKCMDESCKWYVCIAMKPNLHILWMVTMYVGPHTCIPIGVQNDGRMMNCNFIALFCATYLAFFTSLHFCMLAYMFMHESLLAWVIKLNSYYLMRVHTRL